MRYFLAGTAKIDRTLERHVFKSVGCGSRTQSTWRKKVTEKLYFKKLGVLSRVLVLSPRALKSFMEV
jgi:hypothetical protein